MRNLLFMLFLALFSTQAVADDGITGFWTTVDDETNEPKSVVQIYEHEGKFFGRVVDLLKNKDATAKIKGNPAILGLDIIWNLEKDDDSYAGGKILDPKKGKVYGCEIWKEGDKLIVRGKIAFLGRNQTWLPNTEFKPADNTAPVPQIPVTD